MSGNRTIDIKINYTIDTSALKQAQTASQQAQKATDDLRQSATQSAANASAAYKQTAQSIETLRGKVLFLKEAIINSSDPTKVKQLSDQYKALKAQLDQATQAALGTGKALRTTTDQTQGLVTQFGNLVSAVRLFLAAGLVKEIVSAELEMAKLAGNVQGVKIAFDKLPNSIVLLDQLKQKTHGTVSEFDLMKKAVFAADFGIPVKNLGTLLEFAAARAQQTGLSVDYLVDSIVRGIGQKSILRLDNLGLSAERLKNELGGASLKAKSIGEVTEAVTKIAQEELGKMGGYVETSATKVDQFTASWTKLKTVISEFLSSSKVIDFFKGYTDALGKVIDAQNKGISVQELLNRQYTQEAAAKGVEIIKQDLFNDSIEHNIDITKQAIALKTHELIQGQEDIKTLEARQKALFKLQATQNVGPEFRSNKKQIEDTKNANAVLIEQIKILNQLEKALLGDQQGAKKSESLDTLEELEDKLKDLTEAIRKAQGISTQAGIDEARRLKFERDALQDRIDKINETIFREEELQRRRDAGKSVTKVADIDPEKIKSTLTPLASQGKAINDLTTNSQYLFEALGRIESGFDGILNGSIKISKAGEKFIDLRTNIEKAIAANKKLIEATGINIVQDQLNSIVQSESDAYSVRINNLNKFYNNQIALAGDNQRAQNELEIQRNQQLSKLQKEQFEKDKQVKKLQAIINGAAAAARAFVDYEIPEAFVIAGLAAAEVASQVAIIDRQQPGFAKGVIDLKGPGTTTSDSIPARLSKGESVMTAKETFRAKGVLQMVRANKLDDSVLKELKMSRHGVGTGFTDERIVQGLKDSVEAIKNNTHPDIVRIANDLFEVKKSKDGISKTVRRKAIRNG